jgi:hypothetical protein
MKQWIARGEYGIQIGDSIKLPVFEAASYKEAVEYAVAEMQKSIHWKRIGRHNLHVEEFIAPTRDIIRL